MSNVVKKYVINRTSLSKAFPSFANETYNSFRSQWLQDNLVESSEEFSEDGLQWTISYVFEDQAQLDAFDLACYNKQVELGITPLEDTKALIEADDELSVNKQLLTD
jgi:hypothetical protein